MTNIIKLFDNLASPFSYSNGTIVPSGTTPGYNPINLTYINNRVAYLARNLFNNGDLEFESGIGNIVSSGNYIALQRESVVSSSNNNNVVAFSTAGSKVIYIVPNEVNNKNAFNNFVQSSGNFVVDTYKATYVVDLSSVDSSGLLPASTQNNAGLILEFKTTNTNNHTLSIIPSGSQKIDGLSGYSLSDDNYIQFLSTGSGWLSLSQNIVLQSGTPQGSSYSLQINDGNGGFDGSNIYTNENHDLLIGDKFDYTSILRASGNNEFNLQNGSYNFIVYGKSGKNLFFDADGKLGLNMPPNYIPQVPLHIFQTACAESIRVENRHSSNPSILTLYHKPSIIPSVGDTPAAINLSGKNDSANQINYAVIKSKILNSTTATTQGAFVVDIADNEQLSNVLDISKYYTKIGIGNSTTGNHTVLGKNNIVSGSNNIIIGDTIYYSGNNTVAVGRNNNYITVDNDKIQIQNSGYPAIVVSSGNLGIGKNPSVALDVNGSASVSSITSDEFRYNTASTTGQLIVASGENIIPSDYNVENIIVGNTSGILVKTGPVSSSGLSNIYINNSGLNINADIQIPNLVNNYLLTLDNNNRLSNYSYISLGASAISFDKNIKVNTNNEYTIDGNEPDIFTDGYVVTSGLVIDRSSVMPSGAMLVHMGNGLAKWKTITGNDLIFNDSNLQWNKYPHRNATINSSTQITINDIIDSAEFVTGDTIGIIQNNNTYYTTINSQSIVNGSTVLLVATMGISSGSAEIYSTTRGGYLSSSVTNGATTNRFSIRPGTATILNSGKANIDFGVYGSSNNYALYINADYDDNNNDESQVVINGSVPYNISSQNYATLTVNGYLYAEQLRVSGNVDIDFGVVVFTGVAP
jgi:hypothetical protein